MLRGGKAEKILAKPDAEPQAEESFDFDFSSLGGDTNWCVLLSHSPRKCHSLSSPPALPALITPRPEPQPMGVW
eukprot:COSAG05_NODE_600_length_8422_cov_35.108615_10_plen_74_part_00